MNPDIYIPINPWIITQPWGVLNDIYKQFGFSRHNGIDSALGHDDLVRAPFDVEIVKKGNQPNGGGIYVGAISKTEYLFPDGKRAKILVDFLHCERIIAQEAKDYIRGEPLAIQDNTGFSTGPHTHSQWRRVTWNGITITEIDKNDANNSFDPSKFFKTYAEDYYLDLLPSQRLLPKALRGEGKQRAIMLAVVALLKAFNS